MSSYFRSFLILLMMCGTYNGVAFASSHPVLTLLADKHYEQALEQSRSADTLMQNYTRWSVLKEPEGYALFSFPDALQFLMSHPHWPMQNRLRISVEATLFHDEGTDETAHIFCRDLPPISGRGMIACARLLTDGAPEQRAKLTQGWIQGDFDSAEERRILARYGAQLTSRDHIARVERLLYEEKTRPALRLLSLLPSSAQAIAKARIALITDARHADQKIVALPTSVQHDAGVFLDRIRARHRKGQEDAAATLFMSAPANPPYASSWWPLRHYYARKAMAEGRYTQALQLVNRAGTLSGEYQAEALWLSGWLRMEYLNDTRHAYEDFFALYNAVSTPVSKARAAYWAARSAERNGNPDIAERWLKKAAHYPTVFYGQLAIAKRSVGAPLPLPVSRTDATHRDEATQELLDVAMLLLRNDYKPMARIFIEQIAVATHDKAKIIAAASRLRDEGNTSSAVHLAKSALRRNITLPESGWPTVNVPPDITIEPALILAIVRQESEFDSEATSGANAVGLMQLLPSTARHVAKRKDIDFSPNALFAKETNMRLGSAYLSDLIGSAGGSYVAAIAGYNAGPGTMRNWLNNFGHPGQSLDQTLRWIESIPYGETRNYVQRVIENLQIYRAQLQPGSPLKIESDLLR
jgi:soluble lytic murein transglycosylase